jgi:nucleotide-binding universal stress UspA family protein
MTIPVPSLSASGWVIEIAEKADKLMANFFASDYSQSNIYKGSITSLAYMVREWSKDTYTLSTNMERELFNYLSRYFEEVQVDVSVSEETVSGQGTVLSIELDVIVVENGQRYSLGHLITTMDSQVIEIIKTNNGA